MMPEFARAHLKDIEKELFSALDGELDDPVLVDSIKRNFAFHVRSACGAPNRGMAIWYLGLAESTLYAPETRMRHFALRKKLLHLAFALSEEM